MVNVNRQQKRIVRSLRNCSKSQVKSAFYSPAADFLIIFFPHWSICLSFGTYNMVGQACQVDRQRNRETLPMKANRDAAGGRRDGVCFGTAYVGMKYKHDVNSTKKVMAH